MSPDEPRDPSVPKSFETLGEHYRLRKKLGEGGFGVVYQAHHDLLGQDFAVKILKPELCEDENLRERFLDEARALIRFSHTNVVQLRHVGEHDKRLYLVMDLVLGEPLDELLRSQGALSEERAVNITLQVLAGLEAAHAAGIVHRDLKPSNLIVEKQADGDNVRILDFGLSKLSAIDGMQSAHRSVTGAIIGTLAYMSPEQLSGESDIDARSDVFAAGLVLHEMLAGHHPYPGESGIVVAAKLLREPVPEFDAKRAEKLKPSTLAGLRQALERDRDARFSSAFAFSQTLEGKGPPSDTSRVTTIQDAREALARAEAQAAKRKPEGSKKGLLIAALVVILGAAGAFFALQNGDMPEEGGPEVAKVPEQPAPPRETVDPAPTPATVPDDGPGGSDVSETPPPPPETPEQPETPPVTPEQPGVTPEQPAVTPEQPPVEEPEQPAVTPQPPTEQPPIEEPAQPVSTPVEPAVTPETPAGTAEDAARYAAAGEWMQASAAWRGALDGTPKNVTALRGAAMSWLEAADEQARRGQVDEAHTTLDALIAWLTTMYKDVYEPGSVQDRHGMIVPLGFALTHRGEAHIEKARWYRVQGDTAAEQRETKAAQSDLDVAWQFLDRDGENYWDFLLRRADWHRLNRDAVKELADLELTTAINSELVPPRMWVAHFNGLRRKAERQLGARDAAAQKTAKAAQLLVRSGESWARRRKEIFTREQWLDAARVLFVNHLTWTPDEDRTPLQGLMSWYLKQAREQPAPTWESADLAEARVLPLEAGLALAEAAMLAKRGQSAEAAQRQADALAKAQQAVALREKVAATGERLVAPYPYVVLAQVLHQTGRAGEVQAAIDKARTASAQNPE